MTARRRDSAVPRSLARKHAVIFEHDGLLLRHSRAVLAGGNGGRPDNPRAMSALANSLSLMINNFAAEVGDSALVERMRPEAVSPARKMDPLPKGPYLRTQRRRGQRTCSRCHLFEAPTREESDFARDSSEGRPWPLMDPGTRDALLARIVAADRLAGIPTQ